MRAKRDARGAADQQKPKQIATTGHRYGAFLRISASMPTAPIVTAKKVMVVDGKRGRVDCRPPRPDRRLGRGRLKIALVDLGAVLLEQQETPTIARPRHPATKNAAISTIAIT